MSKVEVFENQRASAYNDFVEIWIPNYRYFMDLLPGLLRETEEKNLLVAGCGTGTEVERFVHAKESWSITGVDPSPEMIAQAIHKFKNENQVRLVEGVVGDLPIEEPFGAATLLLVLHFMEDDGTKLSLLKDIAQRLRSKAPLVLLDITGSKQQIRENLQVLKKLLPDGLDEEDVNNRLHRIENKLHPVSEDRLSELLEAAGFEAPLRFFQNSIYMGWLCRKL